MYVDYRKVIGLDIVRYKKVVTPSANTNSLSQGLQSDYGSKLCKAVDKIMPPYDLKT